MFLGSVKSEAMREIKHRGALFTLLLLLCSWRVVAQPLSDSYYRENPSWLDAELWASDGDYYTLRADSYSPYERFAIYGFGFVDYSFRGEHRPSLTTRLGQMELSSPLERYPDYALLSLLRRVPSESTFHPTISIRGHGGDQRTELYDTSPLGLEEGSSLRLQLASRGYRAGVGYKMVHQRGDSAAYTLALGGRWGRDRVVEGLFSSEAYLWLSGQWRREVREGLTSSFQAALMLAPQMRSGRSWNSAEVFDLAGNRHYNSYWGYQQGRVRSSRLRREAVPTLYASWDLRDAYILSHINVSTLVRAGRRSSSSLDWSEAPNPSPDYWGYLPGGQSDPEVGVLAESVWMEGDTDYTQIDWERLYEINRLSTSGAHYLLVDSRRELLSAEVDASAALLGMQGGRVGVRGGVHSAHDYQLPRDMLGAESVGEGFDLYDYRLLLPRWELYGWLYGDVGANRLYGAVEFGGERVGYRSAHSGRSLGAQHFTTLTLKGAWLRALGTRQRVGATVRYERSAPFVEDLLGATEGAVTRNPWASEEKTMSLALWGEMLFERGRVSMQMYASHRLGGSAVEHFWHDPTDQYAALMAGGLESLSVGAELSVRAEITSGLNIEGHLALGRWAYTSDAVAQIVDYDTGADIVGSTRLRLRGLTSSSSPSLTSALVAKYFTERGWLMGAEWVFAAGRIVEPSLALSSDHIYALATTPEEQAALSAQHSLGAASSLNLFVHRSFGHHWSLSLSVRNLLSSTSAYRGGYQPSRLKVRENETISIVMPHDARYQHIYPRHFYLTIGYEF